MWTHLIINACLLYTPRTYPDDSNSVVVGVAKIAASSNEGSVGVLMEDVILSKRFGHT